MSYNKQFRVVQWYQELGTLVQEANKANHAISQLRAQAEVHRDNKEAMKSIGEQKGKVVAALDKVTATATGKSKRSTLGGCEELLGQIEARLESLQEIQRAVRQAEAVLELSAALGEFDGQEGMEARKQVEANITELRTRADKQLELVDQLIPANSNLVVV